MLSFTQMPDENLMDFISGGHALAFETLVKRHHQRFYHTAYRWVMNREDAEEVVQQSFLKLWSGQARWKANKKAKFTTWFYTVLYHQSIDLLRRRPASTAELGEDIASTDTDAETALMQHEQQRQLAQALASLPERQRMAIHLCYESGLKQKEVAAIMGLNIKALESLLTRARDTIRQQLCYERSQEVHYA